jgi:CDP-diacylglycerol--glycerol-3-phosphate 3-phosphatidyltransferase
VKLRDAFHPAEILYPSNLLTAARLLLLPFTLRALRRPDGSRQALLLLAAAMLTDAIDGPIARMRGEESMLGRILDPIADKLLVDTTAIALSQTREFPWWATALLLFRDIGILLCAMLILRRRAQITVSETAGKATTVALTATALLYIADGRRSGQPALLLSMLPFALSFWQYGRRFIALMRQKEPGRETRS